TPSNISPRTITGDTLSDAGGRDGEGEDGMTVPLRRNPVSGRSKAIDDAVAPMLEAEPSSVVDTTGAGSQRKKGNTLSSVVIGVALALGIFLAGVFLLGLDKHLPLPFLRGDQPADETPPLPTAKAPEVKAPPPAPPK